MRWRSRRTDQGLAVAIEGDPDALPGHQAKHRTNVSAVEIVEIATGARNGSWSGGYGFRSGFFAGWADSRGAAGWRDCSIRLYAVEDGHEIDTFACPATRTHPALSLLLPDCRGLAAGLDDTTVVIFNVSDVR